MKQQCSQNAACPIFLPEVLLRARASASFPWFKASLGSARACLGREEPCRPAALIFGTWPGPGCPRLIPLRPGRADPGRELKLFPRCLSPPSAGQAVRKPEEQKGHVV